jgi:hypothetical protein
MLNVCIFWIASFLAMTDDSQRHCEERSDEAIQSNKNTFPCHFPLFDFDNPHSQMTLSVVRYCVPPPRHCEKRSNPEIKASLQVATN